MAAAPSVTAIQALMPHASAEAAPQSTSPLVPAVAEVHCPDVPMLLPD